MARCFDDWIADHSTVGVALDDNGSTAHSYAIDPNADCASVHCATGHRATCHRATAHRATCHRATAHFATGDVTSSHHSASVTSIRLLTGTLAP